MGEVGVMVDVLFEVVVEDEVEGALAYGGVTEA